jgi:DNA replication ATP-dependent helicase Dna2
MRKLSKNTLALTFKLECDRFPRLKLATDKEIEDFKIKETHKRHGRELMQAAGKRWEAEKYQDLIDVSPSGSIVYDLEPKVDSLIGRRLFKGTNRLFDMLRGHNQPLAIIEAEFEVPSQTIPGLQEVSQEFGLGSIIARPDIIWIRPARSGVSLLHDPGRSLENELHIIDIKLTAEPAKRHFTEVTFYALALEAALKEQGLDDRYAVSSTGLIWPGTYDADAFRNLVEKHKQAGETDPITIALQDTLVPVPYEIYLAHVKQFFAERLPSILKLEPQKAAWHIKPQCQFCDYLNYCVEQAESCNHLSLIPWLSQSQADLLRKNGIETVQSLTNAVKENAPGWQKAKKASHDLRASSPALIARANALESGQIVPIQGRKCALMPAWSDQSIFLTIHFDPGSGITFAMGASREYYPPGRKRGDPPVTAYQSYIVDKINGMNPETEREQLIRLIDQVSIWLLEISEENMRKKQLKQKAELSSHIFIWDALQVNQLKRMIKRHLIETDIVDRIELLARFYPPDDMLPDPDIFRSQPGTTVKDVVRLLLGMPIPYDYTLLDTASVLSTGRKFRLPFGFWTEMSDQIPFERAHELWQGRIILKHPDNTIDRTLWKSYSREEILEGIDYAIQMHLQALMSIVKRLRLSYRDRLTLTKSAFIAAAPSKKRIPEKARNLITFQMLNAASDEMENRQNRLLPVEEREAKFFSIRDLRLAEGSIYDAAIEKIRKMPRHANALLIALTFASTSRDTRIEEGDFLLAISNEECELDLDMPWRKYLSKKKNLNISFEDAEELLDSSGVTYTKKFANKPLKDVLRVEMVKMEPLLDPPFLVIRPSDPELFKFVQDMEILDLHKPMVIDQIYSDFASKRIETILRTIGGKSS